MNYGDILRRAWDIIWEHKFLILLGVIIALTSTSMATSSFNIQVGDGWFDRPIPRMPELPQWPDLPRQWGVAPAAGLLLLVIAVIAFFIGLIVRIISFLAQGSLVAAVNTLDGGGRSSFGAAFQAGWQKGWRLIAIGFIPAIPIIVLLAIGILIALLLWGLTVPGPAPDVRILGLAALLFLIPAAVLGLITLALEILRAFATRACMIEDLGVFASYRRGWQVLIANLGEAIVLALIQIAISITIGLLSVFPGVFLALCCLLWPVLLLLRGAIAAYFSTLWTLAWRGWTIHSRPELT